MAKDPAFLFYSNDFYEGTRTMLPEERACYIDLLIYQHQHGNIPNNPKRITMYCSGCSEETIVNVLNQKFNQTVEGWSNQKLNQMVSERSNHRPKKIAASVLAGLISSSKLDKEIVFKVKKAFRIEDFIEYNNTKLTDNQIKEKIKEWFNHLVNHLVNVYEDEIEDENKDESIKRKKRVKREKPIKEDPILIYPWDSEDFKKAWGNWLEYKSKEFGFKYKSIITQQITIDSLKPLAKNETEAVDLINHAISKNWKGFFPIKKDQSNNGRISAGTADFKF